MSRVSGRVFGVLIILSLVFARQIFSQSMRLQDAPLGSVVQIGSFNYVKVAENKYMQSSEITCPDSATVGGMYVKCFKDKSAYESACSGSGDSGDCKFGYTYNGSYWHNNTKGTCVLICGAHSNNDNMNPLQCVCESGWATPEGHLSYTDYGNACTSDKLECGANSQNNKDNYLQCDCDEGYYYVDNSNLVTSYTKDGGFCKPASQILKPTSTVYNFSSLSINTWTVTATGYYKLEVWGAQGGTMTNKGLPGYGGYSQGVIKLQQNEILYVVVGGTTSSVSGGYNGGGSGVTSAGGGGATHIATITGLLSTLSSNQESVLIVAGGGGGGGYSAHYGGNGGGYSGGQAKNDSESSDKVTGGTQTEPGTCNDSSCRASFGKGGNGYSSYNHQPSGGGGGWYGGGGGWLNSGCGAGGGSGHLNETKLILGTYSMYCYNGIATNSITACGTGPNSTNGPNVSATATANYAKSGNGYARITLMSVSE